MNDEDCTIVICSTYEREIRQQLLRYQIYNFISFSQIDFGGGEEYYDEAYFEFQKELGKFGGKIKSKMFQPHITENMTVVEFGSGGGYMLDYLVAKEKIGIEINDAARKAAEEIGIRSVKNISDIDDEYADIIISTSVLEHVENPLGVLRELRSKLKTGGKIVFHVPNESCDTEYTRNEINNHLYTWNCLTIGNLFKAAGYFVYSVEKVQEVWPKNFFDIEKEVSSELFESICEIGGRAYDENRCVIVAYK
jgi:2-polyprenyl-3-methyl-5-hydroxy-6-metoxy-1,4-benzoquinol methylase